MAVTQLYLQILWAAFIEANVVGHKTNNGENRGRGNLAP